MLVLLIDKKCPEDNDRRSCNAAGRKIVGRRFGRASAAKHSAKKNFWASAE
jgi:hypothetical protein